MKVSGLEAMNGIEFDWDSGVEGRLGVIW